MVEVVVALTKGDKSSDDMVARRVAVIEWLVSEPMSQRVDAESGLLEEEDSQNSSVNEPTEPITPTETGNEHG